MLANIGNYVASSVEGLADKLAAAQQVYDDADAAQEAVDAAAQTLREARLNARTKADVSALEELIAYVNSLDLNAYTSASVAAMNVPYAKALKMITDEEVTQEKVDQLAEELQSAVDELVEADAGSVNAGSDTTNTAAVNTAGAMFGLLLAAGAAVMVIRRRHHA